MVKLEVICPVFNESEGLKLFTDNLKLILNSLSAEKYSWRILFVHDPSGPADKTWGMIQSLGKEDSRISGISMWKRFGVQAALWAGIEHTQADVVITMDSDGQHPPELILDLIKKYEESHSLVLTKRFEKFRPSIWLFYRLQNLFSTHPSTMAHSDFRLLDRKVIDVLINDFHETKPFMRVLMGYWGKVPVIEFKVKDRIAGKTSFNLKSSYDYLIDVILTAGHFPVRYLIPLLIFPPFIYCGFLLVKQNWLEAFFISWLGLFSIGLSLTLLHLETILIQSRRRPIYLVKEKINLP